MTPARAMPTTMQSIQAGKNDPRTSTEGAREHPLQQMETRAVSGSYCREWNIGSSLAGFMDVPLKAVRTEAPAVAECLSDSPD